MFIKIKIYLGYGMFALCSISPLISISAEPLNSFYLNQQMRTTPQEIRDPFTPSDLIFQVASKSSGIDANGFIRSPNNTTIPKMRLRGFVHQDKEEPIALLEIAGSRTYLVREGDDINVDPSQPNSVIRITKISRLSITVEAGVLGSIRIQR